MRDKFIELYVQLLGEPVPVWAPFHARQISDQTAELLSQPDGVEIVEDDPEFFPGDFVRFEERIIDGRNKYFAIAPADIDNT